MLVSASTVVVLAHVSMLVGLMSVVRLCWMMVCVVMELCMFVVHFIKCHQVGHHRGAKE